MLKIRSNEAWEKINEKIIIKAKANGLQVNNTDNQKRKHIFNQNLQDYFVSSTVGKNVSNVLLTSYLVKMF